MTRAKMSIVNLFINQAGLSQLVLTHVAKKGHTETAEESFHFISLMRQKIAGMNPDDIIDMDQTPIPYSYHSNWTLEAKGTKTIHM
jgi:hypothetical protein